MVIVTEDAERKHDGGDRANRREYEQIRLVDPMMQDREVFGQRVAKDNHEEHQHAERENGNLPMRHVANLGLAFLLSCEPIAAVDVALVNELIVLDQQ